MKKDNLIQRLDPRFHLAAAIGWSVFALVMLAALASANLAANEAERRARVDAERLLTQFATQIRYALAMNLETRRSIVQASASQIAASRDRSSDALRRHLEAVQVQFPEFAWFAVADDDGRVTASSSGVLLGANVSAQPWFRQGRHRPFVGEVHDVRLPERNLSPAPNGRSPRFVDIAVPLAQTAGRSASVLGAHISWTWIERLQAELLRTLDRRQHIDLLLAAEDGTVLVGPSNWLGRKLAADFDVSDAGAYLIGRQAAQPAVNGSLNWTVIARQDVRSALGPARTIHREVFLVVLMAGLASAVAAVLVTSLLMRRLAALADAAQAVRRGAQRMLAAPGGKDEVHRIGATLAEVVEHLQQEKQSLLTLNTELDARVTERTVRIERMADEARHAAVNRERLRLARDLHDTLAHSLMALLTQIRLVRKLRSRFDDGELEAELGRAEGVAASGLAEARAAIAQMRHNGVRDAGLGPALRELLARFGERSGVAASLRADRQAADLAGERAETVFRIVEEALHNVERHAQARSVRVALQSTATPAKLAADGKSAPSARVRVEIVDDGIGFDPALLRPGHYGLRGIQEQAALIEAQFEMHSRPGEGTRINLEFDA